MWLRDGLYVSNPPLTLLWWAKETFRILFDERGVPQLRECGVLVTCDGNESRAVAPWLVTESGEWFTMEVPANYATFTPDDARMRILALIRQKVDTDERSWRDRMIA